MATGDLLFWKSQANSADLAFGDSADTGDQNITGALNATLQELTFSAKVVPVVQARALFSLQEMSFNAAATYESQTSRPIVAKSESSFQKANQAESVSNVAYREAIGTDSSPFVSWKKAAPSTMAFATGFESTDKSRRSEHSSVWQNAERMTANRRASSYQDGDRTTRLSVKAFFENARRLSELSIASDYQDADRSPRAFIKSLFNEALLARTEIDEPFSVGKSIFVLLGTSWQEANPPDAGVHSDSTVTPEDGDKYSPTGDILFFKAPDGTANLIFNDHGVSLTANTVVPVRKVYIVINTLSLVRLSDGLEIPASDLNVSIDADSWAWGWSATVPAKYMSALQADLGDLVELVAVINGRSFRLAVEKIQRSRSFARSSLTISGKNRAVWLSDPYALKENRTNSSQMTAQQLMAQALTENGASLGWDLDWQITDWLIPSGVWVNSGTAIEACLSIANAAGAYLQSDPYDEILRVIPRYPTVPWEWSSLTPDIDLPEGVCVTEGIEYVDKAEYNTVYISGQNQGILGHVTRSGSGGNKPAEMITDALITHADAARQRGISVLSDTGRQRLISLSLPVIEETGIILPGKLIRYSENGTTHLGLSRSVSVAAAFPKVRQNIVIESHVL